ncbi:MAG TPA: HEAT repeat domain-containing protein [Methanoculleus sp.]|nr:HEAT repeat domain-containing protein [Methanoculleus sp.]
MTSFDDSNGLIPACLETDRDARSAGVRKFVAEYSDGLGRKMGEQLRTGDKETRARAMEALAAASPQSLPVLTSLMEDEDWIVRYRAAEALGLAGEQSAVETLRAHLTDGRDHVRYMSVKSLGLLHAGAAADGIAGRLREDENPYVRRMAVTTLARMDEEGAAELFRRVRRTEQDPSVIAALDEVIGEAGNHA